MSVSVPPPVPQTTSGLGANVDVSRRVWTVGDECRYFSKTHGRFLGCKIQAVSDKTNSVKIDVKANSWVPASSVCEKHVATHPVQSVPSCASGHPMKCFAVPAARTFRCNVCNSVCPAQASMWGCRACNYDLCTRCSGLGAEPAKQMEGNGGSATVATEDTDTEEVNRGFSEKAADTVPPAPKMVDYLAVAIKSHHSTDSRQLNLAVGDAVNVLEEDPSGWLGGHKTGSDVAGWFPGACVRKMMLPPGSRNGRCSTASAETTSCPIRKSRGPESKPVEEGSSCRLDVIAAPNTWEHCMSPCVDEERSSASFPAFDPKPVATDSEVSKPNVGEKLQEPRSQSVGDNVLLTSSGSPRRNTRRVATPLLASNAAPASPAVSSLAPPPPVKLEAPVWPRAQSPTAEKEHSEVATLRGQLSQSKSELAAVRSRLTDKVRSCLDSLEAVKERCHQEREGRLDAERERDALREELQRREDALAAAEARRLEEEHRSKATARELEALRSELVVERAKATAATEVATAAAAEASATAADIVASAAAKAAASAAAEATRQVTEEATRRATAEASAAVATKLAATGAAKLTSKGEVDNSDGSTPRLRLSATKVATEELHATHPLPVPGEDASTQQVSPLEAATWGGSVAPVRAVEKDGPLTPGHVLAKVRAFEFFTSGSTRNSGPCSARNAGPKADHKLHASAAEPRSTFGGSAESRRSASVDCLQRPAQELAAPSASRAQVRRDSREPPRERAASASVMLGLAPLARWPTEPKFSAAASSVSSRDLDIGF